MSVAIWARKTVALGLAATLAGPGLGLLSAQEAQETQEEKQARKQRQAEKQQQKEQEQAQRQREREERAARQQEKAQQEQEQRQRDREERTKQQQDRQAEQQRERQDQREEQAQRQRERAEQLEQERAARKTEQAERQAEQARQRQVEESQRQQSDQAQRDAARRERRAEQARVEAEAQAAEQARAAEAARAAEQARANQQALENQRAVERAQQEAIRRQPVPGRSGRSGERVITERQRDDIIRENRSRSERFAREWDARERLGVQRAQEIQRQRRSSYYRYQQRYMDRLRAQWRYDDWRRYDYDQDPFFWSAPTYRYRYGGSYYQINDYGADLLREAVNHGYEEGFLAGQADRVDRFQGDYRDSYVYEDASYGYRGLYVDQRQYAYYFRQGFDRGYADGYNSRNQYGYRDDDNTLKILAGVLAGILILEAIN